MRFTADTYRLKLAASPHTPNCLMWVAVTPLFNFGSPARKLASFFLPTPRKPERYTLKIQNIRDVNAFSCTGNLKLCRTEHSHEVRSNLPRCISYDHLCHRATISHASSTARTVIYILSCNLQAQSRAVRF